MKGFKVKTLFVHRCTICNKVDDQSIATELDDYSSDTFFVPDPSFPSTSFICSDCEFEINELRQSYAIDDEQSGKEFLEDDEDD